MSPKQNWLTRERVFAAVEAALASGISPDAFTASLVADRLNTGSRATVYKDVAAWRQEQATSSAMPPFVLSSDMRAEALTSLEQLLAAALRPTREEMHREVEAARDALRTAALERDVLLADLERTEDERDRVAAEGVERQDEVVRLRAALAEAQALNVTLERDRHGLLLQLSGQRKQAELDLAGGSVAPVKGQREQGAEAEAGSVPQEAAKVQQGEAVGMSLFAVPQRGRAVPGPMRAGPGAPPPLALSPRERDNLGAQRRSKRLGRGAAHNWTHRKVHPIVGIAP